MIGMSLRNPDEEYDDLIQDKPKLFNFNTKKIQPLLIILIIGIVIGIFITNQYIDPLLNNSKDTSNCSKYIQTNEILNKENTCLYELLNNSKDINKCTFKQP
ncbi:MAG TPA: hypothetical protein PKK60_00640 [archaeon]|nr:hypothetical protein [archaeon]